MNAGRIADVVRRPFLPFEIATGYVAHVDGKTRLDGTRGFLTSRGIDLPEGDPGDSEVVWSVHYLTYLLAAGLPHAVVTSSKPWRIREAGLDLERLAASESGIRGTSLDPTAGRR